MGGAKGGANGGGSGSRNGARRRGDASSNAAGVDDDPVDPGVMSLREAVEAFAQANDLAFVPKPGRTYEGLQVYSFGGVSVAIDTAGESLRAKVGDRWAPVSLDTLLKAHEERARAKSKTF